MPCMISFTVETDGRLVDRHGARSEAIETVDDATDGAPAYYMINCAHPTHFMQALRAGEAWLDRVYGVKANASTKSHAELDESETLDAGDPVDLGRRYSGLRALVSDDAHPGRLLRHRPPPHRGDLRGLRAGKQGGLAHFRFSPNRGFALSPCFFAIPDAKPLRTFAGIACLMTFVAEQAKKGPLGREAALLQRRGSDR